MQIIFVRGIPGADHIPGLFSVARARIHRETIGNRTIDDWLGVSSKPKPLPAKLMLGKRK